jgi:tripartite-type tricarboxylate transporter receptor subunit TctC
MQQDLGVPVVVETRAGAGGQLAAQAVKLAAPDGKTLLLTPDHTMVTVPLTVTAPGYDSVKDFTPVGQVARYLGAFAVANNTGVKTLPEFFAWAKANPGKANVGIPAPGSIPHFGMLSLAKQAGVPLTTVPYKGSAPLVQDLLGGQLAAGTTAMGDFLEPHAAGRMRILAVVDSHRSALVPDVPTFAELGYKLEFDYWLGMFAPAKTEAAMVQRLNASINRALALPDVKERMKKLVFEPAPGTPAAMGEKVQAGMALWAPQVKAAGWVMQ